jgi:O-antigen ligase
LRVNVASGISGIVLTRRATLWAIIGSIAGFGAGVLPVPVIVASIGGIGLLLLGLAQPAAMFVITLIVAPLNALISTERPGLPEIGQIAFGLMIGVWAINRIATRRPLLVWSALYWPLIAIILAAGLSLFVALSPQTTVSELIKWVEVLIMAVLAGTLCLEQGWRWPVIAVLAAACTQALIGLYQFFGGSGSPSLWILDNHYFRAFGTFGQPNPFGACLGLALPVALGLLWGNLTLRPASFAAKRSTLLLLLVVIILLIGGLIASWSRGAWFGAVAAVGMMIVFAPHRRWIGLTIAIATLGFGGLALASGLVPASLASRLGDFTNEISGFQDVRGVIVTDANYAVIERLAHWQAGLAMAAANPWLGVGFGNYEVAYPQYRLLNWPIPLGHAHNYYINMAAETGIIGAGVYILAWLAIFVLNIRLLGRLSGVERGLALGLLGTWTYLSVHSLFDKLYVNNLFLQVGALIGILGGLWVLAHHSIVTKPLSQRQDKTQYGIALTESTGTYGSNCNATSESN